MVLDCAGMLPSGFNLSPHPLWLFLISFFYFFTREPYFTAIFVSIVTTLAAVWLLVFKISKTRLASLFALFVLIFSAAFLDFSNSGLENPTDSFASRVFFLRLFSQKFFPKTTRSLSFFTALAALTRPDSILIFLPPLVFEFFNTPKKFCSFKIILLGFAPLIFWEFFSIIYFGFLFPNTAFAKLASGVDAFELFRQGGKYFLDSFIRDPVTLSAICAAAIFAISSHSKKMLAIVFGMILYSIYLFKIGGDFMSGRFLTPLLFVAVVLFSQISDFAQIKKFAILVLIFALIGFGIQLSENSFSTDIINEYGIADEREYYLPTTGIQNVIKNEKTISHFWAEEGQFACWENYPELRGSTGFYGFYAPRYCHIVDFYGLSDAFVARLPSASNWRVGHFGRVVPEEYLNSLLLDQNKFQNPEYSDLFEKLKLITRGPLFTRERWRAIFEMNF